jgi:hypothetical protein
VSELLNQLQPSMRAFFEAFLPGTDPMPDLEALHQAVGPELEITVGRHLPFEGYASNVAGYLLLPRFAIHVEPDLVHFRFMQRGNRRVPQFFQAEERPAPAAPAPGTPATGASPPGAPRVGRRPHQYSLVKIHERIDPMMDDEPTMTRLLADLPAEEGRPPDPAAPARWARALLAMRQADIEQFRRPLEELREPPANAPTRDVELYKRAMYTFATYLRDGRGTYYPKQLQSIPGEGGLPTEFPEGTTLEYRRINTEELVLEPNKIYCLVNVPDGWGTGVDRQAGHFREIVFRLDEAEGGGVALSPVSWATRVIELGNAPTRDFFDFCFFVTGTETRRFDLPIPEELRDDHDHDG